MTGLTEFVSTFNAADITVQNTILRTAILPRFTLQELSQVTRMPPASDHLEMMEPFADDNGTYTLPKAIQDYLCQEFQRRDGVAYKALHRIAANYYIECGQRELAIRHMVAIGEIDPAAAIAEKVVHPLLADEQDALVLEIHALLKPHPVRMPNVYLAAAVALMHEARHAEAYSALMVAESQFRVVQNNDGLLRVHTQIATIHLERGNYLQALDQCDTALHQIRENSQPVAPIVEGPIWRVKALAHTFAGNHADAMTAIEQAITHYEAEADDNARCIIYQDAVVVYSRARDQKRTDAMATKFIGAAHKVGNPVRLAWAYNSLGVLYHERGNYELAKYNFNLGLELTSTSTDVRSRAYLMWGMADFKRDTWHYGQAEDYYIQCLQHIGDEDPILRCKTHLNLSKLMRWQEEPKQALAHAHDALFIAEQHNMDHEIDMSLAMVDIVGGGDPATYLDVIAGYETDPEQYIAAEVAHMQWPYDGPVDIQEQMGALVDYYYSVMSQPTTMLKALRLQTLGKQRVLLNEMVVQREVYEHDKTALAFFIFVLNNWPVTKQQIIDNLLPEKKASTADNAFGMARRRARLIVPELIVFKDNAYYIKQDVVTINNDFEKFKGHIAEADRMFDRQTLKIDHLRSAIALYNGDFLPALDHKWVRDMRYQLNIDYSWALTTLSKCMAANGDYDEAIALLDKAIAVNPFDESFYRMKMRYLYKSNNHAALVRFGDELEAISEEKGIKLSDETWALYRRLTGEK